MSSIEINSTLNSRIRSREARVGLGYVGLPFAFEKTVVGYDVHGIKQNPKRAQRVGLGARHISWARYAGPSTWRTYSRPGAVRQGSADIHVGPNW